MATHGAARHRTGDENRALTGLRGVAACFVVVLHFFGDPDARSLVQTVVRHGYVAVDLFFVLSGYVMALTYASGFARPWSAGHYLGFLGKRLARVYPLYLAVLLFALALAATVPGTEGLPGPGTVAANLLMVQNWGLSEAIVGPTWSISTEWAVYLLFPLLLTAALGGGAGRGVLAGMGAMALLAAVASRSAGELHQVYGAVVARDGPLDAFGGGTAWPLLRCVGGFVLGLLAFRVAGAGTTPRLAAGTTPLAVLTLVLLPLPGSDLVLVPVFAALVAGLASGPSLASRLLSARPVHWLGVLSYSIYLVHRPLEGAVRHPLLAWLEGHRVPHAYSVSGAAVFLATLAVSVGTFALIERPARRLLRRAMHARARPMATDPAAP